MEVELTYQQIELILDVEYIPFQKETLEQEGIQENFDIISIYHKGEDITLLIGKTIFEQIHKQLFKNQKNG